MSRREFPTRIRVAAALRATDGHGIMRCETVGCNAALVPGRWQLDHIRPDALNGEPSLANAACICELCWKAKNPQDTRDVARAKRREAAALGATKPTTRPIQSAGFPKTSSKRREHPMRPLAPKPLFVEETR